MALRRLAAAPVFTLFAIVAFALAIGSTTAVYSIFHSVFGPPPGVRDFRSVVNIRHVHGAPSLSWREFVKLRDAPAFQAVMAWAPLQPFLVTGNRALRSRAEAVSGNYFEFWGVSPELGRTLLSSDDRLSATPVVVISHSLWEKAFDRGDDVVGRLVTVDGQPCEIVGVVASSFHGLFNSGLVPTDLWIPMSVRAPHVLQGRAPTGPSPSQPDRRSLQVSGRLGPESSVSEAATELQTLVTALQALVPAANADRDRDGSPRAPSLELVAASSDHFGRSTDALVVPIGRATMGAAWLVFLVSCTTLTNLMLARMSSRRHETATELALGATRWRIVRSVLLESFVIAIVGSGAGLLVAWTLIVAMTGDLEVAGGIAVFSIEPTLNSSVLMWSAGSSLAGLFLLGLWPAIKATHVEPRTLLASTDDARDRRWHGSRLVIVQVSMSVALLVIAALCTSQLGQIYLRGATVDHVAFADVDFGLQGYSESRTRQVIGAVMERFARSHGNAVVAVSSGIPIAPNASAIGNVALIDGSAVHTVTMLSCTSGVFSVLKLAIQRGRGLSAEDTHSSASVVVVDSSTAMSLFGTLDVLGRQVSLPRGLVARSEDHAPVVTIVGVAADADLTDNGSNRPGVVYLPVDQYYNDHLMFVANDSGDPLRLVDGLKDALASVDPHLAIGRSGAGRALIAEAGTFFAVAAILASVLGALVLAVTSIGLYGLLVYLVGRRTREIGVRISLGASPTDIVWLVLRQALRPILFGTVTGMTAGMICRVLLATIFRQTAPLIDIVFVMAVPVILIVVGCSACVPAAYRAGRVDPNIALRHL